MAMYNTVIKWFQIENNAMRTAGLGFKKIGEMTWSLWKLERVITPLRSKSSISLSIAKVSISENLFSLLVAHNCCLGYSWNSMRHEETICRIWVSEVSSCQAERFNWPPLNGVWLWSADITCSFNLSGSVSVHLGQKKNLVGTHLHDHGHADHAYILYHPYHDYRDGNADS